MDFALVSIMIFILWLAARKTKKLLKRLEPEEQLAKRPMIVIKADLSAHNNTHLVNPESESESESKPEPEPQMEVAKARQALDEESESIFEVETAEEEVEVPSAVAESEPWKEFSWEPESQEALAAR